MQFEHSAMRCGEVVTYHKRNDFPAYITPLVGNEGRAFCSPLLMPIGRSGRCSGIEFLLFEMSLARLCQHTLSVAVFSDSE